MKHESNLLNTREKDLHNLSMNCDVLALIDYRTFSGHFMSDPHYAINLLLLSFEKANDIFRATKFGEFENKINVITSIRIMAEYSSVFDDQWNALEVGFF